MTKTIMIKADVSWCIKRCDTLKQQETYCFNFGIKSARKNIN